MIFSYYLLHKLMLLVTHFHRLPTLQNERFGNLSTDQTFPPLNLFLEEHTVYHKPWRRWKRFYAGPGFLGHEFEVLREPRRKADGARRYHNAASHLHPRL
jgi:hypothetical protein